MLFSSYLNKWKNNNDFPHFLIINNVNCCNLKQIAKDYLKSLVCKDIVFCGKCEQCRRVDNDSYIDFIYISNDDELIKKEDVMQIQNIFNNVSTEPNGIKLYVIKNIESANKFVINSLLKFLEEPPKNTYALFFTRNVYSILPTIRSRSHFIKISDDLCNIDDQYKDIIKRIFSDYDQYQNFLQEHSFENIFNLAQKFIFVSSDDSFSILDLIHDIKKLSKYEFAIFIDILIEIVPIDKKPNLISIKNNLKLNINKNTLLSKILSEIK